MDFGIGFPSSYSPEYVAANTLESVAIGFADPGAQPGTYDYHYDDAVYIQGGPFSVAGENDCVTNMIGGTSPTPVPPSEPCAFEVTFVPSGGGGEVYGTATDTTGNNWFLKGYAPYSNDFLSPGIVLFGSLPLGGNPSAPYPITLYDPTAVNSTYLSATISGEDAGDFAVIPTTSPSYILCGNNTVDSLEPASQSPNYLQSCSPISVEFQPSALGIRNALLTVATSIDSTVIPLQGYGQYQTPPVSFMPVFPVSSFDFGNVTDGMSGVPQTVTLTMADQDAARAQVTGPFVITGPTTCAQNATTCQFTVNFSPTQTGPQTGSLTVTDTVGNVSASATLTGTGL